MTTVSHTEFPRFLKSLPPKDAPTVWLVFGEDALCEIALESLMARLLPAEQRAMACEVVENDDVADALSRLQTYSLLSTEKVVILKGSRIFYGSVQPGDLLEKARDAYDKKEKKRACRWVAGLLGIRKLRFEDVQQPAGRQQHLSVNPEAMGDGQWLDELIGMAVESGMQPLPVQDSAGKVVAAIENGFPGGHVLIITADMVDKRRGLYKLIDSRGVVVDCSVPAGSRKQDQMTREAVLRQQVERVLAPMNKRMEPWAFQMMCEMTGFDLRMFERNLEKLVAFVGTRDTITQSDVAGLIRRTRQDPIYALTNALAERNAAQAAGLLGALLGDGLFPLQILSAMANQVRKLMRLKGFLAGRAGGAWHRGISYPEFQRGVVPLIQADDQENADRVASWEAARKPPHGSADSPSGGKRDAKKKKPAAGGAESMLLPKGRSPYPLFLGLQHADGFTFPELVSAFDALNAADRQLKTSPADPRLVLEMLVIRICTKGGMPAVRKTRKREYGSCTRPRSSAPSAPPATARR